VNSFSSAILRPVLANLILLVNEIFRPDTEFHKHGRPISRPIWWFRTNDNTWIILEQFARPLSFGDHTMKVHVFSAEDEVGRRLYGI